MAATADHDAASQPPPPPPACVSLLPWIKATKVSSVLNGSREFGKQNLFDGAAETCWNSDQGTPQFIQVSFAVPVCVRAVSLTFQGGFVGTSVQLAVTTADASPKRFVAAHTWEPRDCNHLQRFEVQPPQNSVTNLRLIFPQSTDFFGRITLYALDIEGAPAAAAAAAPGGQPAQAASSLA